MWSVGVAPIPLSQNGIAVASYILAATGGIVGALLYWFVLRETEGDDAPPAESDAREAS